MNDTPAPAQKRYKIIRLTAANFKRLTAVDITPGDGVVEITGQNDQGKSSLLDSIYCALGGKDAAPIEPIRRGEDDARIDLDLGPIKVHRRFSRKEDGGYTTAVIVESADGARFTKPQERLNGLIGWLSFDPLSFIDMKPAEQFKTLATVIGVDIDADAEADGGDTLARRDANRDAKTLWTRIDGMGTIISPDPVDEEAIRAELNDVERKNNAIRMAERALANLNARIAEASSTTSAARESAAALREQAERLLIEAKEKDLKAEGHIARATAMIVERDALPQTEAVIIAAPINERLHDAIRSNAARRQATERAAEKDRLTNEAVALDRKAQRHDEAIKTRRAARDAAVAAAKLPIAGLGLGDGIVTLDGFPLSQVAKSKQIRTSVAIGAALNPKLRVMLVHDGSLLDSDGMAMLAAFAEEHDMQIFVERVDSSGAIGFVIEDGHLKGAE